MFKYDSIAKSKAENQSKEHFTEINVAILLQKQSWIEMEVHMPEVWLLLLSVEGLVLAAWLGLVYI